MAASSTTWAQMGPTIASAVAAVTQLSGTPAFAALSRQQVSARSLAVTFRHETDKSRASPSPDGQCFCHSSSPGTFDLTRLDTLQDVRRIACQAAKEVSLGFAVASRASVRRSTFILPAVSDLAMRC